ncbi:MAG: HlyD family secretion protein [Rhodospirillaceae bacterium]|nr:HlyD family secretion protein [Rhodospirillaceae bacterium]
MNAEPKISLQTDITPDALPQDKKALRRVLMMVVPAVIVAAGAAWYAFGGRYVGTDNAYIKAEIAAISPEVAGNIKQVLVTENQAVTKGQPLVVMDDTNFRIMLAASEAQLRTAIANIDGNKARYRQKAASMALMQSNAAFAEREFKRQSTLAASNFVAAAKLDEAKHSLESARQNIALLKQEEAEILASLEGDADIAPQNHSAYQAALAGKVTAETQIQRATIVAPFDGIVSQLPKVGDYARTGAPLLSMVSNNAVWIEANFKETDLTHMRVGQEVKIDVDTYPSRPFHGRVTSISQATGAEFSLLPAQNSTGNWVKVVQRIPVRISVEDQKDGPPLRSGMSVTADVDTGRNRMSRWFGADAATY